MNKILYISLFLFITITVCVVFTVKSLTFKSSGDVVIPPNSKVSRIVVGMRDSGAINGVGSLVLKWLLSKKMQYGVYVYNSGESVFVFSNRVVAGESKLCSFTFIPGQTMHQHLKALSDDSNFSGIVSNIPVEGSILPDTYSHKCQTPKNVVVKHAVLQMEKFLQSLGVDFKNHYFRTFNELLTLASIVEKETSLASERGLVASVFVNRLKIGMRLQTDPTVVYQQSGGVGYLGRMLMRGDLQSPGVFNTYKNYGLPPHPIASPSRESILATINPADTKYLYFVAKNRNVADGHHFSKSYKEHQVRVLEYRSCL